MGMREEIQAELAEAFDDPDGLADAVKSVTGVRKVTGEYDPDLGGETPETTVTYSGRGVLGSYLSKEIDGSLIQTSDKKLLVLQNELFVSEAGVPTAVPAAPAIGDIVNGLRVMNVSADPADATWTAQLRK
ncbi:hypothetical protein D7M10_05990 [Pseudomonas fluorescens]|uniref:Uncharacterized protein n=1 Tax=Pseudomonas hygromyciniae TaxID=2812000 RepID=A0ABX7JTH0_9PSED|nr:hypothetical protein [Pseudomonas hygromyciniae]AYG06661.1 hypothetical protein D7M10_05990 [Pseudomonas fluorescens]MBN0975963.1 hypothetical protein [Pseudomonas hygromyciniae]QSB37717.1 hypothetical protein JTY93_15375 [Pseudomonas hygromyciniae]